MKFINRHQELDSLNKKWSEKKAQLVVIYGKRRVGKTELIKKFLEQHTGIYFLADKRTHREQLKELGRVVGTYFQDHILTKQGFSDWLQAFEYLSKKGKKKQFIFAVDEYPYLSESDQAVSSLFQKGWDQYLARTRIFLILCGSSVAMMESETLSAKSPLFGRRTGQILLQPLNFQNSSLFFPNSSFQEFMHVYAVTGGIPAYLKYFSVKSSFENSLKDLVFDKTGILHNEVEFIIRQELREPKNYLAILKAISFGKTKFSEMIDETGLEKNVLHKYLYTLENLQIIKREIPVTEKNPARSNKGIYIISENFIRFWFQSVYLYKSDLEIGLYSGMKRVLDTSLPILEAISYEDICQEILKENQKKIFPMERIGRWWERGEEIDVIGLNTQTKEIIFGEAKYSQKKAGGKVYNDLVDKAKYVDWNNEQRKEYFILFSKSGFEESLIDLAREKKIFLVEENHLHEL